MILGIALAMIAAGQDPAAGLGQKFAVMRTQQAIVGTHEGQREAARLTAEFAPEQEELRSAEAALIAERKAVDAAAARRSAWWPWRHRISGKRKAELGRQLDAKFKALTRRRDEARATFEAEQVRVVNRIGKRMMGLLDDFAKQRGYSLVVDEREHGIKLAGTVVDITAEMIQLYNKTYP